jgi:NPCBM/NEW2 domain
VSNQPKGCTAAQHRGVVILLALALSGALAACGSESHSASVQATTPSASATTAAQSTSAPVTTEPASASATPTLSTSPALATSIEDLQTTTDSEPYDTQGVAEVNGVSYPDSLGAQFCFGSNERMWTYVLERKYSTLQGTIGLSDNSIAAAKIRFEVLADGRVVYSKDLQVGQSAALNVSVVNVLQLGLDTILLTQAGGCGQATGEWAGVQVAAG